MAAQVNSSKHLERRVNTYPPETTIKKKKNYRGRNTFELILWGRYHPDTETKEITHTHNHRPIPLMNINEKFLNYQAKSNDTLKE